MTGSEARPLGPHPRVAAVIAYSAWWVSGVLVYVLERDRPAVRFDAMQSVVAFGVLFLAWLACWTAGLATLLVSARGFFVLERLAEGLLLVGGIVWVVCLCQAARGIPIRLPVFARWTDRVLRALDHEPPATTT